MVFWIGNDFYNNNRFYLDIVGSEFIEKMWLCLWSDEIYFWYDEIEDNDLDNFNFVVVYFV